MGVTQWQRRVACAQWAVRLPLITAATAAAGPADAEQRGRERGPQTEAGMEMEVEMEMGTASRAWSEKFTCR